MARPGRIVEDRRVTEMTAADLERLKVRELLDLGSLPTRDAATSEDGHPPARARRREPARVEIPIDREGLGKD